MAVNVSANNIEIIQVKRNIRLLHIHVKFQHFCGLQKCILPTFIGDQLSSLINLECYQICFPELAIIYHSISFLPFMLCHNFTDLPFG